MHEYSLLLSALLQDSRAKNCKGHVDGKEERLVTKIPLPTTIPIVLNVVMIISYIWFVVDVIRGHVHHSDATFNYALVNAMSLVWLGIGVLAHCNSIAINKFNEYLENKYESEQ